MAERASRADEPTSGSAEPEAVAGAGAGGEVVGAGAAERTDRDRAASGGKRAGHARSVPRPRSDRAEREVVVGVGAGGEVVGVEAAERTVRDRRASDGGVRLGVPDTPHLLWWGGLGVMAVVGLLDWPVALVIGAGSLVAERLAGQDAAKSR
jgi:hypothetical protein